MANLKRLEVWFINNFVNWLDEEKKKKLHIKDFIISSGIWADTVYIQPQ